MYVNREHDTAQKRHMKTQKSVWHFHTAHMRQRRPEDDEMKCTDVKCVRADFHLNGAGVGGNSLLLVVDSRSALLPTPPRNRE